MNSKKDNNPSPEKDLDDDDSSKKNTNTLSLEATSKESETNTNQTPGDNNIQESTIENCTSKDESLPPSGYDDSVMHLEQDLQKLVDHLEAHERNLATTQKRYYAEQQQKLSNISIKGKYISTSIVEYENRAKELKTLIQETQDLIDKRSKCTTDSRSHPELFFPPGGGFLKHTDVIPTNLEIEDSNRIRKAARTEKNRRKRRNNKLNKQRNKEYLETQGLNNNNKKK